jgi:hypothetical protein
MGLSGWSQEIAGRAAKVERICVYFDFCHTIASNSEQFLLENWGINPNIQHNARNVYSGESE